MTLFTFLAVLLSAFLHASWNIAGKKVAHIMTIPMFGFLFSGLCLLPTLITHPVDWIHWKPIMGYTFISAQVHAIYIVGLFKAYEKWEVNSVYPVVRSTGVVICAIASIWFFKDQLSSIGLLGIGFILTGIIIKGAIKTLESKNTSLDKTSIPVAIFVGSCVGVYLIIDRVAITYIQPLQFIALLNMGISALLVPYCYYFKKGLMTTALRSYKKHIILIGLSAVGSYLLILWVFKHSAFGYITSLRESSIIFATILSYFLLKEKLRPLQLLSIILMLIGAILIKLG